MKNFKEFIRNINWIKILEYSMPAIITIGISILSMVFKGVYPFGSNQFGYIDYNAGLVPQFTAIWDFYHGNKNALIDWNLGSGGSSFASWGGNILFYPLNIIIALFPRESVIYSTMLLVIIKMALMSTTAYICFKKFFNKIDKWTLLLFSLIWTFSGWTMVHFTNVGWLEIMILLPLLFMSAHKLIIEHKNMWFVIILSYMLILTYYITFMVLVAVVGISTLYIVMYSKDKKKTAASTFFAIVISILISMFAFIPSCVISLGAHRFADTNTTIIVDADLLFGPVSAKFVTVFMYALPVVFFVRLLFSYKTDKKNVKFFIISFAILSIGLIVEPINKMLHTGSYAAFPFRHSFNIIFLLIIGSLYYINKKYYSVDELIIGYMPTESKGSSLWHKITLPIITIFIVLLYIMIGSIYTHNHPYNSLDISQCIVYLLVFALTYFAIEISLCFKSKRLKLGNVSGGLIIFILCITQILAYMTGFISYADNTSIYEISNAYQINTEMLDTNYKIKDRETLYNPNFAYLTNFPSMSTWIHISSEEQWQGYAKLGYNHIFTMLYSSGGTIMTDTLLGNKYVLSREILDTRYYTLLDSFKFETSEIIENKKNILTQTMYLYEYNISMNPIFTTNVDLCSILETSTPQDPYDAQNKLFKTLYNSNENIFSTSKEFIITEKDDSYHLSLTIPQNKVVYMLNNYGEATIAKINSFDRIINMGLTELGIYNSDTLEFEIYKGENYDIEELKKSFMFGFFDIELFKNTHETNFVNNNSSITYNKRSLNITLNNQQLKKYALIPYTNLSNMIGSNNSKPVDISPALDAFMQIELETNENNITITYSPKLFTPCIIITIISITIFITFIFLNKKFDIISNKYIIWGGFIGSIIILTAVGFLIYIKPGFNFIKYLFM